MDRSSFEEELEEFKEHLIEGNYSEEELECMLVWEAITNS